MNPKLSGLFDSFDNLDHIDINNLIPYIKNPPASNLLENYLGSKILYPQTLPQTAQDLQIDLAILREALRINGPKMGFLNVTLRKIIIPERFLHYVGDLTSLVWAFVDGLLLNRKRVDQFEDVWTVVLTADFDEVVGSVLLPRFAGLGDKMVLSLQGRDYKILAGSLVLLSCPKAKGQIAYKIDQGQLLGQSVSSIEVAGGKLGLMIDGRRS